MYNEKGMQASSALRSARRRPDKSATSCSAPAPEVAPHLLFFPITVLSYQSVEFSTLPLWLSGGAENASVFSQLHL